LLSENGLLKSKKKVRSETGAPL